MRRHRIHPLAAGLPAALALLAIAGVLITRSPAAPPGAGGEGNGGVFAGGPEVAAARPEPTPPRALRRRPAPPDLDREAGGRLARLDEPGGLEGLEGRPAGAGGVVLGRVLDEAGAPVEGARVRLRGRREPLRRALGFDDPLLAAAETDAGGAFLLDGIPPGSDDSLEIFDDILQLARLRGLTVREGQRVRLPDIVLRAGIALEGRVVDGAGSPVAGAHVTLRDGEAAARHRNEDPLPALREVTTNEAGRFRLTGIPAGLYVLVVRAAGLASHVNASLLLRAGTKPSLGDIVLSPARGIQGIVASQDGGAVEGAVVRVDASGGEVASSGSARTDRWGRFAVAGLAEGPYVLRVIARGFGEGWQPGVLAGRDDVVVTLRVQGAAEGEVWDLSSRLPIRSFRIRPVRHGRGEPARPLLGEEQAFQDPEGRFRVEGLEPGTYALVIDAPGHAFAETRRFTVREGETIPALEVWLGAGGRIRGHVVGEGGLPVAGARVDALDASGRAPDAASASEAFAFFAHRFRREARTGAGGAFVLEGLPGGRHVLRVIHPDYPQLRGEAIEVREGEDLNLGVVRLGAGVALEGQVILEDGQPAPGILIRARGTGRGAVRHARTGPDGRWEVRGLPAGECLVEVVSDDPAGGARALALARATHRRVRVDRPGSYDVLAIVLPSDAVSPPPTELSPAVSPPPAGP